MNKKLKFVRTVDDRVTEGKTYEIKYVRNNCYHFSDNQGNNCSIYDKSCYGEYAILITNELSKNIKIL